MIMSHPKKENFIFFKFFIFFNSQQLTVGKQILVYAKFVRKKKVLTELLNF